MKCCLSSRMPNEYLKKADEIKVAFRDYKSTPDIFTRYPEARVILELSYNVEMTDELWDEIRKFNILGQGRLILCLGRVADCQRARNEGYKFYYGYPVQTFIELRSILDLGVYYIRLGTPLFFDMEQVKIVINDRAEVRAVPNVAFSDGLPKPDGVNGQWIRPEDLEMYEDYIDVIEFEDCDERKESALYRIYMEEHEWPGNLDFIITNLNHAGVNRMILPEVTQKRLNCGQKCARSQTCHICYRALDLANPELIQAYVDEVITPTN